MKLTDLTIERLVPIIIGGEYSATASVQYRSLSSLVTLFQQYDREEINSSESREPINPANGLTYSRKDYTRMALREMNNTSTMFRFLKDQLNDELYLEDIKRILTKHHFSVEKVGDEWCITNIDIDNAETNAEISFAENRDKIISAINRAKVSIDIAMAWFTSNAFLPILLTKHQEGVTIRIILNRDAINQNGCNLDAFNVRYRRGEHGGFMHNKLCIIDNQIVITGFYNWSDNAENHNVENVALITDNNIATRTTLEFRRLWEQSN